MDEATAKDRMIEEMRENERLRSRVAALEAALSRLCGPDGPGGCPGDPETCGGPSYPLCSDCRMRWAMGTQEVEG